MSTNSGSVTSVRQDSKAGVLSIALALLVFSVVLNVVAARRISTLQRAIDRTDSQHSLEVGVTVPEIVGLDSKGSPVFLHYGDVSVPTVLYVFTPQCGWCRKNLTNFRALIDQSNGRYRVVGIALTRQDLDLYLQEQKFQVPIYADIRSDVRDIYHLGGTPDTIVVSPAGKVLKVWHGAYQADTKRDIERFLQVHLPDIVS